MSDQRMRTGLNRGYGRLVAGELAIGDRCAGARRLSARSILFFL
jgi:hypothetical protein